jgi:endonuclease/exonuclease/phosphatase family metal-dependent hydrolase
MAWQARKCTSGSFAPILVLSWNLFHGRAQPAAWRPLAAEFAAALAGWSWDVALLQEVPPWWPEPLAAATGASARMALTSRNSLLPLRRAIAARKPDLLRANGGGSNAIALAGAAGWVVNLHASRHPPVQRHADLLTAAATAREWAAGKPLVFGGDLNSLRPAFPGLRHVAGHHVDHVFTEGRPAVGEPEVLDAGPLSDHAPLRVRL